MPVSTRLDVDLSTLVHYFSEHRTNNAATAGRDQVNRAEKAQASFFVAKDFKITESKSK